MIRFSKVLFAFGIACCGGATVIETVNDYFQKTGFFQAVSQSQGKLNSVKNDSLLVRSFKPELKDSCCCSQDTLIKEVKIYPKFEMNDSVNFISLFYNKKHKPVLNWHTVDRIYPVRCTYTDETGKYIRILFSNSNPNVFLKDRSFVISHPDTSKIYHINARPHEE